MIVHALFHHRCFDLERRGAGRLHGAVVAFFFDLLEHTVSDFRVVVWPYRLIHKLFIIFSHREKCRPILPGLHSFVEMGLDNVLRLTRVLGSILIARLLHVLVDGLCVVLLLLVMVTDDLLRSFNSHEGFRIHRIRLLERPLDFHVDPIVVGKELLGKGFLFGRGHFRGRLVHVARLVAARLERSSLFIVDEKQPTSTAFAFFATSLVRGLGH